MRTEPGALYIQVLHPDKVADIVVTSEDKIIILNGEMFHGTNPDNTKN